MLDLRAEQACTDMDLIARISSQFEEHAAMVRDSLELLVAPLAASIEMLTSCLLGNSRILCCGDGPARIAARDFATRLLHGFECERPALAAVFIDNDCSAPVPQASSGEACSRTIRALSQPGDVLLVIAPQPGSATIAAALEAAHERELRCIVISCINDDGLNSFHHPQDILLALPAPTQARFSELLALILNCLGDGIDCLLLGVEH